MSMLVQRSSASTHFITQCGQTRHAAHGARHTGMTSEKAEIPERVGT